MHAKDFYLSKSESTKEKIKGGAMHGMSCAWDKFISSPHVNFLPIHVGIFALGIFIVLFVIQFLLFFKKKIQFVLLIPS
jgi:hypothetical protein